MCRDALLAGSGHPHGIAHVRDVPIGAVLAGVDTVILERRSVRAVGPPIADSGAS